MTATFPIAHLNESQYPGNIAAFEELRTTLLGGEIIGFVGAGASASLMPTWGSLLNKLTADALKMGSLKAEDKDYLDQLVDKDPLQCATILEQQIGKDHFRSILSDTFRNNEDYTPIHRALIDLDFYGFMTTNYDYGLEIAISNKKSKYPRSDNYTNPHALSEWKKRSILSKEFPPVLHLHGEANDPGTIIFTGNDYRQAYHSGETGRFLSTMLGSNRFLFVGFGFSDPFLEAVMGRELARLASEPIHFTFVGLLPTQHASMLIRGTFKQKYRMTPIFYPIASKRREDGLEYHDHSALLEVVQNLGPFGSGSPTAPAVASAELTKSGLKEEVVVAAPEATGDGFLPSFEEQLFKSPAGKTLYAAPILMDKLKSRVWGNIGATSVSISSIVQSNQNFVVVCPPEVGATTLSKHLAAEIRVAGLEYAAWADAQHLPNYEKKLEKSFSYISSSKRKVLVLDNYSPHKDEKLLKELRSLELFDRIIVIMRNMEMYTGDPNVAELFQDNFQVVHQWYFSRPEIRNLASKLFDTEDEVFLTRIVDKTYFDLLGLCMPITPSNVIMYLMILFKEGDYQPLNRVQIVDRYLHEMLRSASEYYEHSFSSLNKLDLLSSFAWQLYVKKSGFWDEKVWYEFCHNYKKEKLVEFTESDLLSELYRARVFIKIGNQILFRFSFFYSYFVGRFMANSPGKIKDFIESEAYFHSGSLIEVITGLSWDNTYVIEKLTQNMNKHLEIFFKRYLPEEFDPLGELKWPKDTKSEADLWVKIEENIAKGPESAEKIDELKKSITAEKRTERQQVTLNEFNAMEERLVSLKEMLEEAIKNSDSVAGETKRAAVLSVLRCAAAYYRIAILFSPQLARHRYLNWYGISFRNVIQYDDEMELERKMALIVINASSAVTKRTGETIGTRKLGAVFKSLRELQAKGGFFNLLRCELIASSKPDQWEEVLRDAIMTMQKDAFYLRVLLQVLMRHLKEEVNTISDRNRLKQLIALIRTKREIGKERPGAGIVNKMLGKLEELAYFEGKGDVVLSSAAEREETPEG
jgi:hypothetical protein